MDEFKLLWPTEYHVITQRFGANPAYYYRYTYEGVRLPGHEGIDLRAYYGSKIFACANGVVKLTNASYTNAYGFQIRIDHQNGYETIYAHLKEIHVKVGQYVTVGQVIGLADSTGNSTGSHLHLTLKKDGAQTYGYVPGVPVALPYPLRIIDPLPYLTLEPVLGDTYRVTARPSLRLRTGPGTQYGIITSLPYGTFVSSAEYPGTESGEWVKVKTSTGLIGFCAVMYLQKV
jgi:murein DD-endopeptidase MepM/ murein hydrolase activator NlpD